MLIALQFEISADFGNFRIPDCQDKNLTFNFIPKTAVLGICGAIIGLPGYKNKEAAFLKELGDFKISVKPLSDKPFRKIWVKFNNYHGYANKDGNGIYQDQLLVKPGYVITIIADDSNDKIKKIKSFLEKKETIYRPYLGKNEFICEINYLGTKKAKLNEANEFYCDSIYPINREFKTPARAMNKKMSEYVIYESYPYSYDSDYKFIKKNFCFEDGEIPVGKADLGIGAFYSLEDDNKRAIFAF